MFENLYHVIMAGGSGTRFWPASRREKPKQFLSLVDPSPMIRLTLERCARLGPRDRIYVSAGEEHREKVLAALPGFDPGRFIGEPVARNTAPAAGLSAMTLFLADPQAIAVFCPADHIYTDLAAYTAAIERAVAAAAGGDFLVTLGIAPTRPEQGYGYIEAGAATEIEGVLQARGFIEKPDEQTARVLASSGRHFWNSGVFIWRVSSILAAIGRHHRVLAEGLTRFRDAARAAGGAGAIRDVFSLPGVRETLEAVFSEQPSISVDYAVMEKAPNVLVVPCDAGWSDVGSWDAIADLGTADAQGNLVHGEVVAVESENNLVRAEGRVVALAGVSDLIVVETADAVLVCRRGGSQKVRDVVKALADRGRPDLI